MGKLAKVIEASNVKCKRCLAEKLVRYIGIIIVTAVSYYFFRSPLRTAAILTPSMDEAWVLDKVSL